MRKILTLIATILATSAFAQTDESIEKLRTQSGIDPTRVPKGVCYHVTYYDRDGDLAEINNRLMFNLGIKKWSFQLKSDFITTNNFADGLFRTGYGDLKFNIQNVLYAKGRNAIAGSVEFGFPTASHSISGAANIAKHFTAMPTFTWSHTLTPSFIVVMQPQYLFNMAKNLNTSDISLLTVRIFVAKFTKAGYFFVFEPRPMYDFKNDNFDLILSPIIGKALGRGYNMLLLGEVPTKSSTYNSRGLMIKVGINANF